MKKVALLLADEENAYQQLLAKKAMELTGRYGSEVLPPRFAGNREVKQISQFYDCIASATPPDGIVSMLVSAESMRGSLEAVAKAGIDCVLVNRIPAFLPQMSEEHSDVLLASVAPDQVEIGRFQGRQCLKILPDGGNVVLVLGVAGAPSTLERRKGFLEVAGNKITVRELHGRWLTDRAEAAVNHLLGIGGARTKVDMYVCQNDPMAAGVRAALDNQAALLGAPEIAKIPIIGCDGLPDEGQKMVRDGKIEATVVMPPSTPEAVEILSKYWSEGVRKLKATLPPTSFPPVDELKPR
jgi:ABC-type sugar transport system substrate-binding protein